jgi:hypothetical protein
MDKHLEGKLLVKVTILQEAHPVIFEVLSNIKNLRQRSPRIRDLIGKALSEERREDRGSIRPDVAASDQEAALDGGRQNAGQTVDNMLDWDESGS